MYQGFTQHQFDFFWDSLSPRERVGWFEMNREKKANHIAGVLRRESYDV